MDTLNISCIKKSDRSLNCCVVPPYYMHWIILDGENVQHNVHVVAALPSILFFWGMRRKMFIGNITL